MEQGSIAKGYVFEMEGGNKTYTPEKKGIPGVLVTNQRQVVVTDAHGYFELPIFGDCAICITKPDGFSLPLNAWNQAQFYYIHRPLGTPRDLQLEYPAFESTGSLPDFLYFPLQKEETQMEFSAIMMGDVQPFGEQEINYFKKLLLPDLQAQNVDFFVPLGDLAWDLLEAHPPVREALQQVGLPYYPVLGNHDINLKSPQPFYARETYQHYFGPTYYSFDYGQVHFIVLDDIGYEGWDVEMDEKGSTTGFLDPNVLLWLRNDLAHTPPDRLIFFLSHIPIFSKTAAHNNYRNITNRERLFELVENRPLLFSVAGHTHCIEHVNLRDGGWHGKAEFKSMVAGAACGAWWTGPIQSDGLPIRMAMDGAPNGFFVFHFSGTSFHYTFHAAGTPDAPAIAIRKPPGQIDFNGVTDHTILVNLFYLESEIPVFYRLNEGPLHPLTPIMGDDPYVVEFLKKNQDSYPEWMLARRTSHLWQGELPKDLPAGEYVLEIVAKDQNGKKLSEKLNFAVVSKKKTTAY
jgi:3',5'-cyclic AMP phosphodiesterase CpdA